MKFRHTNFMRLIYATLLALPFVAILSRVIYVQSNKNAYQSYDGETMENIITANSPLQINTKYYMYTNEDEELTNVNVLMPINNLEVIESTDATLLNWVRSHTVDALGIYNNGQNNAYFQFKEGTNYNNVNIKTNTLRFTFYVSEITNFDSNYISRITYNSYEDFTTLDNVFEYSVNKFIENNNFGKINLFQWTTNLFFDSNVVNNMYVGFINWYLNYTLLVSATYILFLVLMWFINYARRLLERGMNYDW